MQLTKFNFGTHELTAFADENGEPWILANDACAILGYSNPHKAIADHCREGGVTKREVTSDLTKREVTSKARASQEMNFINEGNLYRLILKSKLPAAQKFEELVMDTILPSIRKKGFYESLEYVKLKEAADKAKLLTTTNKRLTVANEDVKDRNEYLEGKKAMCKDERMETLVLDIIADERAEKAALEAALYEQNWGEMKKSERAGRVKFVKQKAGEVLKALDMLEKVFKGTELQGNFAIALCLDKARSALAFSKHW